MLLHTIMKQNNMAHRTREFSGTRNIQNLCIAHKMHPFFGQSFRGKKCDLYTGKYGNSYMIGSPKFLFDIIMGNKYCIYQFNVELKTQPTENAHLKIKCAESVGKKMVALFFSKTGLVATTVLNDQHKITSEWYFIKCLSQMFKKFKNTD